MLYCAVSAKSCGESRNWMGERPIQGLTPMSSVLRFAWSSQPIAMLMLFMLWCWTGTVGEGRSMLIKWHAIYCGSCRDQYTCVQLQHAYWWRKGWGSSKIHVYHQFTQSLVQLPH